MFDLTEREENDNNCTAEEVDAEKKTKRLVTGSKGIKS